MSTNPILEELSQVRARILADHGADLSAYFQAEFERLKKSGHPVAQITQLAIRRTSETTSANSTLDCPLLPPSLPSEASCAAASQPTPN